MLKLIKFGDEKLHLVDAKMKAVRNMKDSIDLLTKQKDIIKNTINQKALDCKQQKAETQTVYLIFHLYFLSLSYIFFNRHLMM